MRGPDSTAKDAQVNKHLDGRSRRMRLVWSLMMLGLAANPTRPARGESGLSEIGRARAAWLKRPYALVYSGDRQLGPDHVHLVRARDARWDDFLALGGAIVDEGPVSALQCDDVGPFAVVGRHFVFRFNGSADFGVLDMDRSDAEVERCSQGDLIAKLGAIPDFNDFNAYHAAHWSWPTPGNVLGQLAFLLGSLVVILLMLVVIPLSIAWLMLWALRRLAPWAFVPRSWPASWRRRPDPVVGEDLIR